MSDASPGMMSTEGMSDATDAFQAAMDAESGQVSKRATRNNDEAPQKMKSEDLFPNRQMDRSEKEGGENEPPPRDPDDDVDDDDEDAEPEYEGDEDVPEDEQPPQEAAHAGYDPNLIIQTTIDGEVVELPLGEAVRSGMRERTFHKYLSQLDLAVRETNQQRQNLIEHYQNHVRAVQQHEAWMNEFLPNPNWPELFRADPTKAMALKVEWDEMQGKRQAMLQHLEHIQAHRAQEEMQQLHRFANANRSQLAAWHPEWRDEKVWRRDHNSMRQTAQSVGYTDDEINALYDARGGQILYWAMRFVRMMANKPKPVKQGFTQGKQRTATPSRNVTRSFDRAERRSNRGSRDSLEATFERMLNSEG